MMTLTEVCPEKYVKKLIGRTEIEDGLKTLDKLTQEEARMAAAQILKVTYTVDERVKGVVDTVVAIDNRVTGVNDRVASVNDRMVTVDDRVKVVDNNLNKVVDVIAGV
jgi:hypothetical protein